MASRSDLDDAAAVNEILKRYEGIVARAKGSPYTESQIVDGMACAISVTAGFWLRVVAIMVAMEQYGGGSSSRRRGTTPDLQAVTKDLFNRVYGAKRARDANVIGGE